MSHIENANGKETRDNGEPARDDLPLTLPIELVLRDPEVIAATCAYPDGEAREQFLERALRIGVIALKQASGQVDADRVRREAERLLENLDQHLQAHSRTVSERVAESLKRYFDPESGQFHERVERLVKRDGELEQVLSRNIGSQDSELTKTLTRHFGEASPLLRWLSPDRSQGLLAELQNVLAERLQEQREKVIGQFSLDNKEGALCRFLAELESRQGVLSKDLKTQIADVVQQFSLDDEDSALSRLVKNVASAERRITREFTLDDENSALARLRRELLKPLEEHKESASKFQEEVKIALAELRARKEEAAAGTRHGLAFEDAVATFIEAESQKVNDIATRTGNTTGTIKNCKVGDVVVELGPDNTACGARIAIEAKEDSSVTLSQAREQIEKARQNRNAQVGLFVFSAKTAPKGLEPVTRFGSDVFVVWNLEDTTSDLYLRVGLTLARALCIRQRQHNAAEAADFAAIEGAILEIEKQCDKLGEIETWTKTIANNCGKIQNRLNASRSSLDRQVGVLNERIGDLRQLTGLADSAGSHST